MKKQILLFVLCLILPACISLAGITGTTNPADFGDTVDWCQLGCANNYSQFSSPTPWISAGGSTGQVGLTSGQSFNNLQEGTTWSGQFANGMGIVYNEVLLSNNTPSNIYASFTAGLYGAGAYVQSDYYGPFTATISLFDSSQNLLGSYSAIGNSGYGPGTALFIGGYTSSPDVYSVSLGVVDQFNLNDIAIGTMGLKETSSVPEPGSMVLLGSGLVTLAGFLRRKINPVVD